MPVTVSGVNSLLKALRELRLFRSMLAEEVLELLDSPLAERFVMADGSWTHKATRIRPKPLTVERRRGDVADGAFV